MTLRVPPATTGQPRGRAKFAHTARTLPHRAFVSPLSLCFVLALTATVVVSATGEWLVGLALAPIALVLGSLWANALWEDLEEPLEHLARRTRRRLWATARVARVSVTTWSGATKAELRIRSRQRELQGQRDFLIYSLGEAVYAGDDLRANELRVRASTNEDRLQEAERELRAVRDGASGRVQMERCATAPTQTFGTSDAEEARGR